MRMRRRRIDASFNGPRLPLQMLASSVVLILLGCSSTAKAMPSSAILNIEAQTAADGIVHNGLELKTLDATFSPDNDVTHLHASFEGGLKLRFGGNPALHPHGHYSNEDFLFGSISTTTPYLLASSEDNFWRQHCRCDSEYAKGGFEVLDLIRETAGTPQVLKLGITFTITCTLNPDSVTMCSGDLLYEIPSTVSTRQDTSGADYKKLNGDDDEAKDVMLAFVAVGVLSAALVVFSLCCMSVRSKKEIDASEKAQSALEEAFGSPDIKHAKGMRRASRGIISTELSVEDPHHSKSIGAMGKQSSGESSGSERSWGHRESLGLSATSMDSSSGRRQSEGLSMMSSASSAARRSVSGELGEQPMMGRRPPPRGARTASIEEAIDEADSGEDEESMASKRAKAAIDLVE